MQEDFLHYLWKHKKFDFKNLKTTNKETVNLITVGEHNKNSGPDFFNAQLKIAQQLWAGNVEIHVKSSDWYIHGHEKDKNYDNVILHVVWEHDAEIFRNDNTVIPTVELRNQLSNTVLTNYQKLFNSSQKWINCENSIASVNSFKITNWLERLYFERLQRKSDNIVSLLKKTNNNWEAVLFVLLVKNFGLKVNANSFASIANSIDFSIIRKQQTKIRSLEALFFGQANLLEDDIQEVYYQELQKEYAFLKQKFNLSSSHVPIQFFRLRPSNFPTIRLSQLANLYSTHYNLFSKIIKSNTLQDFYELFKIQTSVFWETHYVFNKESKKTKKRLTKSFIDLLLINTILPLKFSYAKYQGKEINNEIVKIIEQITAEENSIVKKYNSLNIISKNAMHSQALLQLKIEYCNKNHCLQCAIGNTIISE